MGLETIGDIFAALDELRCEVDEKLEKITDKFDKEVVESFLEEIEDEIQYFNDEDYYSELRAYDSFKDRWRVMLDNLDN